MKATREELREWLELVADLAELDRARFDELLAAMRVVVETTAELRGLERFNRTPLVCLPGGLA